MANCAPFNAAEGYAIALTRYVDCQAALLGDGGYQALAASGSPVIIALGGLLTILIAWQGYRLILGDAFPVRDAILLAARIGLVLAFATQWPAYRSVVYNLVIEAPRDILALLPGDGGGDGRNLAARLQGRYQTIGLLTAPSPAALEAAKAATANQTPDGAAAPAEPTPAFSLAGNMLLTSAGILLLVSGLAVLIAIRLMAGLLLALGPLFFACLLFDSARGLFEGWARALLGIAFASMATAVLLGIELAILEPQLAYLIEAMARTMLPVLAPGEILATVIIFTLAQAFALALSLRIGAGFRFLDRGRAMGHALLDRYRPRDSIGAGAMTGGPTQLQQGEGPSRANRMADAIHAAGQWQARAISSPAGAISARRTEIGDRKAEANMRPTPLGQSYRRTNGARRTRSVSQRNKQI